MLDSLANHESGLADIDVDLIASLSNLEYLGVVTGIWNSSCSLNALHKLAHLHTFFMETVKVEPPLQLSWTRHCRRLQNVSVVDRATVWCYAAAPAHLPGSLHSPVELPSYDRQFFPHDELRRYREAQQEAAISET